MWQLYVQFCGAWHPIMRSAHPEELEHFAHSPAFCTHPHKVERLP